MHSAKVFITIQPCSLNKNNQTDRSMRTFNIRQILGLISLYSYADIDKVELFLLLAPWHLRHDNVVHC